MNPVSRPMARRITLLALVLASAALVGCGSSVGDSCSTDSDCPSNAYCDKVMPDGLCTIANCRPDNCPDGSVCVEFYNGERFCMQNCDSDGDCRDGYSCIKDSGPDPFCSVKVK